MLYRSVKRLLSEVTPLYEALLNIKYRNRNLPSSRGFSNSCGELHDNETIFTEIFRNNLWGDPSSASGSGSNLQYTRRLRKQLPWVFANLNITSVLDAPCGDFFWMKEVKFYDELNYVGGDIVGEMINQLGNKHSNSKRNFVHLDVVNDMLPRADLWLCRDCFIHLSNDEVMRSLCNFVRSRIQYLLTTTYNFGRYNSDINSGDLRYLNLTKGPFNLPKPLLLIRDYEFPFLPRRLALWNRHQVERALAVGPTHRCLDRQMQAVESVIEGDFDAAQNPSPSTPAA